MKIDQYCQRQRWSTSNWSIFGRLSRRAGLSATAGRSCCSWVAAYFCVTFTYNIALIAMRVACDCTCSVVNSGRVVRRFGRLFDDHLLWHLLPSKVRTRTIVPLWSLTSDRLINIIIKLYSDIYCVINFLINCSNTSLQMKFWSEKVIGLRVVST